MPRFRNNNAKNSTNSSRFDNRTKGLITINTRLLCFPITYKMGFMLLKRTIRFSFMAKNPHRPNYIPIFSSSCHRMRGRTWQQCGNGCRPMWGGMMGLLVDWPSSHRERRGRTRLLVKSVQCDSTRSRGVSGLRWVCWRHRPRTGSRVSLVCQIWRNIALVVQVTKNGIKIQKSNASKDRRIWPRERLGSFFVSSAYRRLYNFEPSTQQNEWSCIWRLKLLERLRIFMWIVKHNRLSTRNRLAKWGTFSPFLEIFVCTFKNILSPDSRRLWTYKVVVYTRANTNFLSPARLEKIADIFCITVPMNTDTVKH